MRKDVKENVHLLLERYPAARTCDLKLLAMYWSMFDNCHVDLSINQLYDGQVTKPESIRRARQKIQKENKDLKK